MVTETQVEKYVLDGDISVWIQEASNLPGTGEEDCGFADRNLEKALDVILPLTKTMRKKLSFEEDNPDEVEIEFGLIFSSKFGAILAFSSLEANLKVKMNWNKRDKKDD